MDDRIVFVESKMNLSDALQFSQYIVNNRLVTLISEKHEKRWKCKNPYMSISEYCANRLEKNENCRIVLEYNPGANPRVIGSHTIRETYNLLESIQRENYIIPIDFRSYFLTVKGQSDLYSDGFFKYKTIPSIDMSFIYPYFSKYVNDTTIYDIYETIDENLRKFIMSEYLPAIESDLKVLKDNLGKLKILDIREKLRNIWMRVMDFYIFREILRPSEVNELIVIVGYKHYDNIASVLENKSVKLVDYKFNNGKCVELLQF